MWVTEDRRKKQLNVAKTTIFKQWRELRLRLSVLFRPKQSLEWLNARKNYPHNSIVHFDDLPTNTKHQVGEFVQKLQDPEFTQRCFSVASGPIFYDMKSSIGKMLKRQQAKPNWKQQTWTKSEDHFLHALYEVYELDCTVPMKIENFETVQVTVIFPVPAFRKIRPDMFQLLRNFLVRIADNGFPIGAIFPAIVIDLIVQEFQATGKALEDICLTRSTNPRAGITSQMVALKPADGMACIEIFAFTGQNVEHLGNVRIVTPRDNISINLPINPSERPAELSAKCAIDFSRTSVLHEAVRHYIATEIVFSAAGEAAPILPAAFFDAYSHAHAAIPVLDDGQIDEDDFAAMMSLNLSDESLNFSDEDDKQPPQVLSSLSMDDEGYKPPPPDEAQPEPQPQPEAEVLIQLNHEVAEKRRDAMYVSATFRIRTDNAALQKVLDGSLREIEKIHRSFDITMNKYFQLYDDVNAVSAYIHAVIEWIRANDGTEQPLCRKEEFIFRGVQTLATTVSSRVNAWVTRAETREKLSRLLQNQTLLRFADVTSGLKLAETELASIPDSAEGIVAELFASHRDLFAYHAFCLDKINTCYSQEQIDKDVIVEFLAEFFAF